MIDAIRKYISRYTRLKYKIPLAYSIFKMTFKNQLCILLSLSDWSVEIMLLNVDPLSRVYVLNIFQRPQKASDWSLSMIDFVNCAIIFIAFKF